MALTKIMKKLGRYDLLRVLGKGAMGLVYEGRDPNLDRRVAIKTIKVENLTAEEAADYEVRFRTEARSAARLQHPHIVTVFDSDRDGDVAFLVMEFIDGEDLKHHLDRGDVYTLGQTVGIMGDLLSAMDYAHRQGVVHRDIKPANLLMEPSGRLKLTDFGVARIQDSGDATRTQGSMVGTLKYMSPEQVQGRPIDARSDLFAAGVVLYQLLTSKRPFDGVSDFDVIQSIVGQDPVSPSSITPGLPAAIDAVVARALEKSKDARYASAQEFHTALVAAIHGDIDQTIRPKARPNLRARSSAGALSEGGQPPFGTALESSLGSGSSAITQEAELVYWKDVKDSNEADDFEGFLSRFPRGIYADLARRKLKRLGTAGGDGSNDSAFGATLLMPRGSMLTGNDEKTVVASPAGSSLGSVSDAPALTSETAQVAKHPSGRWWRWGVAGFALVAGVASAVLWGMHTSGSMRTPEGVPPALAVSAPIPQTAASASSSAPIPAALTASVPASALATASVATLPSLHPHTRPVPALASSAASLHVLTKPKAVVPAATPLALPSNEPAPSALVDPRTTCEGRWFLSYQICMSKECARPELAQLPICLERRAQERSNLERSGH